MKERGIIPERNLIDNPRDTLITNIIHKDLEKILKMMSMLGKQNNFF